MPSPLELIAAEPLEEFARDPVLSVACILLIVVSVAWIVVARAISRNFRRADEHAPPDEPRSAHDVWKKPPG